MQNKKITFYRNNDLQQEYTLSLKELADKFTTSICYGLYQSTDRYWNLWSAVTEFIYSDQGLFSTYELKDLQEDGENFLILNDLIHNSTQNEQL